MVLFKAKTNKLGDKRTVISFALFPTRVSQNNTSSGPIIWLERYIKFQTYFIAEGVNEWQTYDKVRYDEALIEKLSE